MNHDDILQAPLPSDESRREEMLEITKTRAKGAFVTKDMPNAEKLYGRAITLCERRIVSDANPDGLARSQDLHLLYSNRAAVRLLLSKFEAALADCEASLDLDAGFIKSHFRKAQALLGLKRFDDAIISADHALELHPGKTELEDLKSQAQKEANSKPAENAPFASGYRPVRPNKESSSAASSGDKAGNKDEKSVSKDGDKEDPSLRGYKKTADGKTTSYFHTELDETAKKLIGDCKPQKLDEVEVTPTASNHAGSAWNQAGTFEERNKTSWMSDTIKAEVKGSIKSIRNPETKIKFSTQKTNGDAQITVARGKIKYVHDMSVTINWRFASTLGKDPQLEDGPTVKGTACFESDGSGDWDVNVEVDGEKGCKTAVDREILAKDIKKGVLVDAVLGKLRGVEKMFKELS